MAAAPRLITTDEYFLTPETALPAELARGVMRVADAPTPRHQSTVFALALALEDHVCSRALGQVWLAPIDVVLDTDRALIVQPDLMFISNERGAIVRDRVGGAPDLVIEVLSPNPRIGKTEEHIRWFAEYGVRECWLVHNLRRDVTIVTCADRRVEGRTVYPAGVALRSSVLPDFRMSLDEILERRRTTAPLAPAKVTEDREGTWAPSMRKER